jgi:hypothetical protein
MKLAELLDLSGLDVLDHLSREVAVPVVDGLQAQGDLIVVPLGMLGETELRRDRHWRPVTRTGIELVRGEDGNNPHTLVADDGTCWWSNYTFWDRTGLGIAVFENIAPAYLVHPEHGGAGVARGRWLVRRQRERGPDPLRPAMNMLVAD